MGRLHPLEDAAAVLHIREAVGRAVVLRADANQKWSLREALQFGHAVKAAGLQVGAGFPGKHKRSPHLAPLTFCRLCAGTLMPPVALYLNEGPVLCCHGWLCLEDLG